MADLEVKAVAGLAGNGVPYAYAVKAGPWIFLTGHEAFDFASGSIEAVAGPPGYPMYGRPRYRREGDFILQRMRHILREFGSDLPHGVRLDQFYPSAAPVDPYHLARRAEFGDYIPPSTSVIMQRCFSRATAISSSLIAVVPSTEYRIEKIYPGDVTAPSTSGFVPTITCNDFVFVAGQMATHDHGLDPRAHVPDHARWGGTEIRKQTEFLIEHKLKPALQAAGSALEHSLKAQVYIEKTEDFSDFLDVWSHHFARIPCALTVVPTTSFGSVGGIIEINLLALKANASRVKRVIEADLPAMAAFGPCVRAGELVFLSGLMAIGRDGHVVGKDVSPMFDGLAHAAYAQASTIYNYAEAICGAANTSIENLVRAQYFVPAIADFRGIAAAFSGRYGDRPQPFWCIETPSPLPAPGAAMIADFWIYAP
jgi:enamine deaminase RidA (YjgF/YER057c/UK114 family)